jgi:hypothetical protein
MSYSEVLSRCLSHLEGLGNPYDVVGVKLRDLVSECNALGMRFISSRCERVIQPSDISSWLAGREVTS